ncbi:DUF2357 domain-containing protein [Streptomyces sp. SID9727]|uniref:DUF2357 domain-containing protein n=1 Tax=Streptomyces sp. SID9727 TaxID=2706114 RepID=UPI0013C8C7B0|nr:DUF2357 domain-containing protein [Streptomyces sp. SID9727]NEC64952.1 DUF2357 domain-containing protein [Streptomyces sp. SID9727]
MKREAAEPELDSLLVRHLLALSARLGEAATLDDWLTMPPIILDVAEEAEALPLEDVFERESGALRAVCHRPYTRLRTVEEVVPTSRVRSIASGAPARLASRPEDWASHTLAGVRPSRLLARRSEEDADIYENRVAVAVLDVMRSHLQQRITQLRDLSRMTDDVHGLLMTSEKTSWRARRDLARLLRNIEDSGRQRAVAGTRLRTLESLLAIVEVMLSSPLARAVDHRSAPRELHPTNLFSSDPHYRRVASLWQACVTVAAVRPGEAETAQRRQEVRVAFERFTGLLLLLACTLLQATPDAHQPAPAPGRTTRFRMRGQPLTVAWSRTGDFTLHWRDRQALRVIPFTIDLCTAPDAASVAASISGIRRDRPAIECDDLIVHPGLLRKRQDAEPHVTGAAYRIGHGDGDASGQHVGVAPLSPLDIFSVSRLVRAVQWATLGADARRYPLTVPVPAGTRSTVTNCDWLEPRADGVAVVRAPAPGELEHLSALLRTARRRHGSSRAAEHEAQRLRTVSETLKDAAVQAELLEVCPVCAKTGSQRQTVFEPREGGLFAALCSACRTRWELRRCMACRRTFPLLEPDGSAAAGAPESDLDGRLGGAFLAVPCWTSEGTGQFICPACSTCGQATRAASCPRGCSTQAPH